MNDDVIPGVDPTPKAFDGRGRPPGTKTKIPQITPTDYRQALKAVKARAAEGSFEDQRVLVAQFHAQMAVQAALLAALEANKAPPLVHAPGLLSAGSQGESALNSLGNPFLAQQNVSNALTQALGGQVVSIRWKSPEQANDQAS